MSHFFSVSLWYIFAKFYLHAYVNNGQLSNLSFSWEYFDSIYHWIIEGQEEDFGMLDILIKPGNRLFPLITVSNVIRNKV